MPPERSTLNQQELDRLVKRYRDAERRIIATFGDATDFGQARRAEQLIQIETILRELGEDTGEWLETVMPGQYERGTTDVIRQLQSLKVGLKESTTMSTVDRRAVAALVSETQEAFAVSLTTVQRNASRVLSEAVKAAMSAELAEGRILGETRREISNRIKAAIRSDGITALTDKAGRRWTLDRYAEMLARTKMVEARNTGLANKMVANGFDLVEVSDHMSDHKECAAYEGKILSLTGKTPGYPTLADAMANGLLHPNCEHQINAIRKNYAALTEAYDPRSGTYKQPFANNTPAAPQGNIKMPAHAPKSAALPTTVTFNPPRGRAVNYAINRVEAEVLQRANIITTTYAPGKRWAANTHGTYSEQYNRSTGEVIRRSLHVRNPKDAEAKHSFYHEIGHAIDANVARMTAGKIDAPSIRDKRLIDLPAVKEAMTADRKAVYEMRVRRDYEKALTPEQMAELLDGKVVKYERTERGRTVRYRTQISYNWKSYALSDKEVFADAYGSWRMNPAEFARVAPNLTKIFEGVENGTIK